MQTMGLAWKQNWEDTKQNLTRWWHREGLAIGMWGATVGTRPHEDLHPPEKRHPKDTAAYYTDTRTRARINHYDMCMQSYPADMFPVANTDMGPGCLALFLGSEPEFKEDTVWMHPCLGVDHPDRLPPIRFDPANKWWKILDAGKAVQPINIWANEVVPLLDAIGGKGVYVLGLFASEEEVEQVLKDVEPFR